MKIPNNLAVIPNNPTPGIHYTPSNFVNYLNNWFFNEDATFNPGFFKYYDNIVFNGNFVTSTNCLERINLALKDTAAGGNMPLSRICRVLKTFKHKYLGEHEDRVHNNNLHKRRSTTVQRENILGGLLDKFNDLPYHEQLESVVKTAIEIGNIGKLVSQSDSLINEKS